MDRASQPWCFCTASAYACNTTSAAGLTTMHLTGWAGGLALWRDNLVGLSQYFDVWAVDFVGWGLSSRPPMPGTHRDSNTIHSQNPCQYALTWPSGDMAAVVRQKVENIRLWCGAVGLSSFTLLGHSLGGYIAARFALEHPDLVTRLVLVCASDIM